MVIIWHGHSCFEIMTTPAKNSFTRLSFPAGNFSGQVKIVIDPFNEEVGLRVPKLAADILLITHSHSDHNNVKAVAGQPFLISGPGEYEIKNIFIEGIPAWHDTSMGKERGENTIYTLESEDLKICHLGDLGQKELTEEQLEKIGEVDILMIPIGGTYTISAKEALKIMSQIEPKITVPMHYSLPKIRIKLDGLDKFLKSLGIKSIMPENKLSIKKKDISPEEARIIVLKP